MGSQDGEIEFNSSSRRTYLTAVGAVLIPFILRGSVDDPTEERHPAQNSPRASVASSTTGTTTDDDPYPSVTFSDQETDGTWVVVDEATLPEGGYVTIMEGRVNVVGHSAYLAPGTHQDISIELISGSREGRMRATLHLDTNDDQVYDYIESEGEDDTPLLVDGEPVSDTACLSRA